MTSIEIPNMNKISLFLSGVMGLIGSSGVENLLNEMDNFREQQKQQTEDEINVALTKAEIKRIRKNERRLRVAYNDFDRLRYGDVRYRR